VTAQPDSSGFPEGQIGQSFEDWLWEQQNIRRALQRPSLIGLSLEIPSLAKADGGKPVETGSHINAARHQPSNGWPSRPSGKPPEGG
jgi:hypothetical protein